MSFALYRRMEKDPVGTYCDLYRKAKLNIAQTLFSTSVNEKAELGIALEKLNKDMQLCRNYRTFDAEEVAKKTFVIDKEVDHLVSKLKQAGFDKRKPS